MKKWISMVLCLLLVNLALPVFAEPEPSPQPDETPAAQSAPAAPTPAPEEEPEATPAPSEEPQAAASTPAPETEPEQDAASRYKESAVQTDADGFIRGTEEGSDYWWKLDDNGTLTIKGSKMPEWADNFLPPWQDEKAFIRSVAIQKGMKNIGGIAFKECSSLTQIDIPEGLTSIGDYAFCDCTALNEITIPDSVIELQLGVFLRCSNLSSVHLGTGIRDMGYNTFLDCNSLVSIELPASVKNVGGDSFVGCSNLKEITMNANNPFFCSVDGMLYNKDMTTLIRVPEATKGEVSVPQSVTSITDWAFDYCVNVTGVALPDGLTNISAVAFSDCSGLASITIPASVTYVGKWAFTRCTSLRTILFKGDAPELVEKCFSKITANVYYPQDNVTWTEEIRQDYSGTLTWIAYDPAEPLPFEAVTPLPDSGFKVEGNVLFGLSPQMNIAALQAKIENGAQIIVKDAKGNPLASDKAVGTGCTVGFGSDGTTGQVQVVVRGDVSGDGDVKVQDVIAVRQQILNIKPLEGVYLQASLIKSKVEPKVLDVIEMRKFILQIIDTLN